MKTKKRILSAALTLALTLSLSVPTLAAEKTVSLFDGVATLTNVISEKQADVGVWLWNEGMDFTYYADGAEHTGDNVIVPAVCYRVEAGAVLTIGRQTYFDTMYAVKKNSKYDETGPLAYRGAYSYDKNDVYIDLESEQAVLSKIANVPDLEGTLAFRPGSFAGFYKEGLYLVILDDKLVNYSGGSSGGLYYGAPRPLLIEVVGNVKAPAATEKLITVALDDAENWDTMGAYALEDDNGNLTNYVSVRGLAAHLNGTGAQFNVTWDGAVNLQTNTPYSRPEDDGYFYIPYISYYETGTSETKVNGKTVQIESILLTDTDGNGHTYYKLRDLGAALGFPVDWDQNTGTIIIRTK